MCICIVFLQIVIAVVAALVVLMICAVFGLWYNNRKYVEYLSYTS